MEEHSCTICKIYTPEFHKLTEQSVEHFEQRVRIFEDGVQNYYLTGFERTLKRKFYACYWAYQNCNNFLLSNMASPENDRLQDRCGAAHKVCLTELEKVPYKFRYMHDYCGFLVKCRRNYNYRNGNYELCLVNNKVKVKYV